MLRIGSVRWRGRCSKHSGYNPQLDGLGGIRGGCRRCEMLLGVYEAHQKLVRLMREFGNREGAKPSQSPVENRQLSLLD